MSSRRAGLGFALALVLALTAIFPGGIIFAQGATHDRDPFQGRYIVELDATPSNAPGIMRVLQRQRGFQPDHVYSRVLPGFSVRLSSNQARLLEQSPLVQSVTPDAEITLHNQQIPPGIKRIGTLENSTANVNGTDQRVDVDIAILDTGIQSSHLDLNYAGGTSCVGGNPAQDGNGHGTHVAGTAAALDNNLGVVGVAPGARLWSVQVFDSAGSGSLSTVICGVDWIASQASVIDVANFSGGAQLELGTPDPLREPVRRLVEDYGVPLVVSAGNGAVRADRYSCRIGSFFFARNTTCVQVPAAYPETITVGAMVDTDGLPGRLGPSTSHGADDSRASFSNFGPAVDVFAPGSMILSTTRQSNTSIGTLSGTSMSSPHVAGAVGLYLAGNPGATPAQVRQALLSNGVEHGAWDSHGQPLVHVAGFTPVAPPDPVYDVAVTGVNAPSQILTGASTNVTVNVENAGNQQMNGVQVSLHVDGPAFGSSQSINLNPGQSQSVQFQGWTPNEAKTYTLVGSVQHGDDDNPANNSAQTTVQVSDPVFDVGVSSISAPNQVTQGDSATVQVTVANHGTQQEAVTVSLSSNAPNANVNPATRNVSVPQGQSRTVSFTWTPSGQTPATGYQLEAVATIAQDDNPGNNLATRSITVLEKPSVQYVYVEQLTASSSRFLRSSTLNTTVRIFNDGGQPVQGASVRMTINSSTVNLVTGADGRATFSGAVSRGTYIITVRDVTHSSYEYDPSLNKVTSIQLRVS